MLQIISWFRLNRFGHSCLGVGALGLVMVAGPVRTARADVLATNEVLCGPTNAIAKIRLAKPQPAGTVRMINRLQKLHDEANPRSNQFLNDRRVKMMEQDLSQTTNLQTKAMLDFQLAPELLNSGRPEEALQQLKPLWTSSR